MPVDRHRQAAFDRRRPVGIGGVDPFAAAVRVPAHQLQVGARRRGRGRRRAVRGSRPSTRSKPSLGPTVADVDLGRQRGEILRGDLRARAGRAQRPVEPVADPAANAQRSGRRRRGDRLGALDAAARPRAWATKSIGSTASVGAIAHAGRAAARQRRDRRAPATGAARRAAIAPARGSDAQATPLHSKASTPALFQPGRGSARRAGARAVERRRECRAWLRDVNTVPLMAKSRLKPA